VICVDPIFTAEPKGAQARRCGRQWCHLFIDNPAELEQLHQLAARIGLKRAWFQDHGSMPHYDLVPSKRAAAVRAGAVEVDRRHVVVAIKAWRAAGRREEAWP